jgi:RNA polymerase sigma-70 factor (ECF subfamily)
MERMEAEAAMVERARGGDTEAFRALVEQHSRAVFRLAYRLTGNEQDAEDVVQEAFLKAYTRLPQFEERAHFGTWVYRIASNCAFDVLRARPRRKEQPMEDEDGMDTSLRTDAPGPDRLAMSAEVGRRLRFAMSRLSPTEKSAFVLRHYEGCSIEEIGAVLGSDTNATKSSIFRAVRKLREALQPLAGAAR